MRGDRLGSSDVPAIAARERADEAGRRVNELRARLDELNGLSVAPARSTAECVNRSRTAAIRAQEFAADATHRSRVAYLRAAEAHERAAAAHETLAMWDRADDRAELHQQSAAQHRDGAARDREAYAQSHESGPAT